MKKLDAIIGLFLVWAFGALAIFTIESTTFHGQIRDIQNEVTQIRRALENAGR